MTQKISFFSNVWDTPRQTCEVDEILDLIKSGEWREETENARVVGQKNKKKYKYIKDRLPAFSFCGEFSGRRKKEYLSQASGFLVIDIDDINRPESLKQKICSSPYVYACFISLGGHGLKILFRTELNIPDDKTYKQIFAALSEAIENKYEITVDPSGKDITRLCTVSYDPDLYVNKHSLFFNRRIVEPERTYEPPQDNRDGKENMASIKYALDLVSNAPDGNRHYTRLKAGRLIGGMVAGGIAAHSRLDELIIRARANTENQKNAEIDVVNGFNYGMREPIWK